MTDNDWQDFDFDDALPSTSKITVSKETGNMFVHGDGKCILIGSTEENLDALMQAVIFAKLARVQWDMRDKETQS